MNIFEFVYIVFIYYSNGKYMNSVFINIKSLNYIFDSKNYIIVSFLYFKHHYGSHNNLS